MTMSGEEYCNNVRGVRPEWDLGCGPDGAKDAMWTRATLACGFAWSAITS